MDIETQIANELTHLHDTDTPMIRATLIAAKVNIEGKSDSDLRRIFAERRVNQSIRREAETEEKNRKLLTETLIRRGVKTDGMTVEQMDQELARIGKAEREQRESARNESDARISRQRSEHFFKRSGCPERHIANISNVGQAGKWLDTLNLLSDQMKFAAGFVVAMLGTRGTGKTQLAVAVIHRACGNGFRCQYTKAGDIFRSIRATYAQVKRGESQGTEEDVFNRWVSYDLLVIDESHERGETSAENQALVNIIDRRYDARRCTIFIGNQTKEEFAKSVGPSIISRIHECGEAIICDWPSYRKPGTWRQGENSELRKTPPNPFESRYDS